MGELLRRRGIGGEISYREAERLTGVSRETIRSLLQPIDPDERRRVESTTLQRLAAGLELDEALLERAAMADWGATTDGGLDAESDLARILTQIGRLHPVDRIAVQMEIARIQHAELMEQARSPRQRRAAAASERDGTDPA